MGSADEACTVYFDGACPLCRREIAHYRERQGAESIRWVDVAAADAGALGEGLDREAALARLHVRGADGRLVSGVAAFAAIWRQLPAYAWLGRLASPPPVQWLLELGYRGFLAMRRLWRPAPAALPGSPSAASPAGLPAPLPAPLPAAVLADLRTDHAGETGAVQIYRGILAVTRDPALRGFATRHLETERSHLERIEQWLPPAHRSRLLFLWRPAGWLTGALPALIGPRAAHGTVQAVETFVDRHYAEQVERLEGQVALAPLRELLEACRLDEVAHRDEAAEQAPRRAGFLLRTWARVVGSGSALAVRVCRRF